METKRPSPIITLIPPQIQRDESQLLSPRSPSPYNRRRKRARATTKTKEQLIMQSYQQLLSYVDNLDSEVRKVVQSYQAQFLSAYREHIKNVRTQMVQIKKQNLKAVNDNSHYIDRIECLEKQLILFRQQILKMSEKNHELNEQIKNLHFKLSQLKEENYLLERRLASVIKQSKETAVLTQSLQDKQSKEGKTSTNEADLSKKIDATRETVHSWQDSRPLSMSYRLRNRKIQLGIESLKKESDFKFQNEAAKSHNKPARQINANKTLQIREDRSDKERSEYLSQRKEQTKIYQSRSDAQKIVREQLQRLRSQEHTQKNEYQKVFIDCVEAVRKQILRKNAIIGLNYFKDNGPKDIIQFKNSDYHLILYLFLKTDSVIQAVFNLLFKSGF